MEFKEMAVSDVKQVVNFFYELAYYLKDETGDVYFDFDLSKETGLEKKLRASIGKADIITFVARENDRVIAFISGEVRNCFLPISVVEKVGYICGAFVLPEYRNKGIMRKLENMLLKYFKSQGLSYIELNVMTNNLHGKRSWESMGYTSFREQMRKEI
ncbi:MAG: GNAT family N-acetyltransferase [Dethiobacteria bacterium]|jgi:ribosomal protein S18 acetylase RimI-like enzyme